MAISQTKLPLVNHHSVYLPAYRQPLGRVLKYIYFLVTLAIGIAISIVAAPQARAQTMTYVNGTDGAINGSTTCAAPLVRNFSVPDSFTVGDVDLGIFATHTWRGDIQVTLQAPDGTRVRLIEGDDGTIDGNHLNVRLDDQGGTMRVNRDDPSAAHSTAAPPPFANLFRPDSALSAFNGKASNGTWRLEMCDLYTPDDDGTFRHAELYLTNAAPHADLSLTKAVSNVSPANGSTISYTLALTNSSGSSNTATGVVVRDLLPAGINYVSFSGYGTYNSATGDWNIASIAPGETRTLTINATVNVTPGTTVTNTAEVTASSQIDIDSTVNNGITTEDDYASRSLTVAGTRVAGTPPSINAFCPANQRFFDWQGRAWTVESTNNNYTLAGIGLINFNLTTDAPFVAGSPAVNTTNTGGLAATEEGLFVNLNNNTVSDQASVVMTLPTAVPGLQFTIFDIDFGAGSFADKITVTGTYNGATVLPTLTNGTANYVVGNTAIGDVSSNGPDADGNVVVTFTSAVDTITILYGSHSTAPVNPGNQYLTVHDITFCNPQATIAATKTSSIVSDPVNGTTDPKAIPGAIVRYCITLTNTGTATASNLIAADALPPEFSYTAASSRSGTDCATAATVEDDDNIGADESDPVGVSIATDTLTITAATLAAANMIAVTFDGTIN